MPKQTGSGGKVRLGGISRRGDTYLRTLLIHGARSVLTHAKEPSPWLAQIKARRPANVVIVAQAAKMARTIWPQCRISVNLTFFPTTPLFSSFFQPQFVREWCRSLPISMPTPYLSIKPRATARRAGCLIFRLRRFLHICQYQRATSTGTGVHHIGRFRLAVTGAAVAVYSAKFHSSSSSSRPPWHSSLR